MRSLSLTAVVLALPLGISSFAPASSNSALPTQRTDATNNSVRQPTQQYLWGSNAISDSERNDCESKQATYSLQGGEFGFSPEAIVRPLLKQTQLEKRKLQVVYNAKKDGFNAQAFHAGVDGKGASVVLAKVGGQWIGGYNPRGWASLGGARSSVASFLFYQKLFGIGGWQKLRVAPTGSMACGRDEYGQGIYFGADALSIPLLTKRPREVTSRLGMFFESGPDNRSTLLPVKGADATVSELYVVSGVYADGEYIPNSGGVSELGFY